MKATDRSPLKVLANSSASLMTTAGGVSSDSISYTARRMISLSTTARRSGRQLSVCLAINGSMVSSASTAPPARPSARERRGAGAGCTAQ